MGIDAQAVDGTAYSYDQSGNLLTDDAYTYTYDAHNRLSSITDTTTSATTIHTYDGDGMRNQVTTAVETTPLLWDRAGRLPEIISDGTTSYLHAPFQTTSLLNRQRWRTRIELANAIFEYLEIFHNRQRRHSSLGMRTPIEYEIIHHDNQPVALPSQAS